MFECCFFNYNNLLAYMYVCDWRRSFILVFEPQKMFITTFGKINGKKHCLAMFFDGDNPDAQWG